ncbi:hypothetical protein [Vibrio hepatarius]|uniref:hypothetical protein n=1 Tax=Vibrio hepatarius TaxID=171383 RepID=UPI001C09F737|nr:hypothetical protein [Vibrio hepatarius]MBU2898388.1 hypothetical protein [Vibrio hepatarius]
MDNTVNKNQPSQYCPSLANKLKQLLKQLDWSISRIISFVLNSVVFIFLIILALSSFIYQLTTIFEYQKGLEDMSTVELVFFISFLILLNRYWSYTKQTSQRWWFFITSPIIWYGKFVLFTVLCASIVAITDLAQNTDHLRTILLEEQNYTQLLSYSAICLSLYIAVPSQTLIKSLEISTHLANKADEPQATQTDPEVKNDR